jgi:hypothetical protein
MQVEQRKTKRKALRYDSVAVSLDGKARQECRLEDISRVGARLHVESPELLGDHFVLMLSERGKVMRLCQVIRRGKKQVAVLFRASSHKK